MHAELSLRSCDGTEAGHCRAEPFLVELRASEVAGDVAIEQDENPVAFREQLIEVRRPQQNRSSAIRQRPECSVQGGGGAPISTPCVGSSATNNAGPANNSRPTMNFWRLPPDRDEAKESGPSARTGAVAMMRAA
jgi:hypothetical protein